LDPLDEGSGWRVRLNNLGYDAGESDDADNPRLRSAIEEFQCDYDLTVDGICGPQTQAKLLERHGC
jgi:N-acetylmuramoyl-L-alanine amidase